ITITPFDIKAHRGLRSPARRCRIHPHKRPFRLSTTVLWADGRQSVSYPRTRASTPWTCTDLRDVRLPQRFFLRFSLLDVPYIYEGSSRRISPGGLADRIQPGEPSGIVDGRE